MHIRYRHGRSAHTELKLAAHFLIAHGAICRQQ